MDGFLQILEFVVPVVITPLVYWVRTLINKVDSLSSGQAALRQQIKELSESQSREHKGVGELITKLEGEHNHHAVQAGRAETKLDQVVRWTEKSAPHTDK